MHMRQRKFKTRTKVDKINQYSKKMLIYLGKNREIKVSIVVFIKMVHFFWQNQKNIVTLSRNLCAFYSADYKRKINTSTI